MKILLFSYIVGAFVALLTTTSTLRAEELLSFANPDQSAVAPVRGTTSAAGTGTTPHCGGRGHNCTPTRSALLTKTKTVVVHDTQIVNHYIYIHDQAPRCPQRTQNGGKAIVTVESVLNQLRPARRHPVPQFKEFIQPSGCSTRTGYGGGGGTYSFSGPPPSDSRYRRLPNGLYPYQ